MGQGRKKLAWTCIICDVTADRKHNMIRHISTVHKITSNIEDNFTVNNKDDIIIKPDKKIIEVSLVVLPSDSIDDIRDDDLKNTNNTISTTSIRTENISDTSHLIDMTDKNVQIDAQIKDIYTQIDVINDLENDLKVHSDTLDTHDDIIGNLETGLKINCKTLNTHNNKITDLENSLKVHSNTIDICNDKINNLDNELKVYCNTIDIVVTDNINYENRILKLENANKILRDDFNKLENANKSLHDENKRLYDIIAKNNINI